MRDGRELGICVGMGEGGPVGFCVVGAADGLPGNGVGRGAGLEVGPAEGRIVGAIVGCPLGSPATLKYAGPARTSQPPLSSKTSW